MTFRIAGSRDYILQRINKNVFTRPEAIASNIRFAGEYLAMHHPEYPFTMPSQTQGKDEYAYDGTGYPWRIFSYIPNTYTIDAVQFPHQAFDAAKEFARLASLLGGVDLSKFKSTLDDFHDLSVRWKQFENALGTAAADRVECASEVINTCRDHYWIVTKYSELIESNSLKLRITHNDTKINNILFSSSTNRPVCAIDLDTLMPGYIIYDVGDMIRTFVSPVSEEERNLSKVEFRRDFHEALIAGYKEGFGSGLTDSEKEAIPFSGLMMTYIMAMRMLTDYLNGDVYYHTSYAGQNLVRASNQFRLLTILKNELGF